MIEIRVFFCSEAMKGVRYGQTFSFRDDISLAYTIHTTYPQAITGTA
jgi:hypothetical protein